MSTELARVLDFCIPLLGASLLHFIWQGALIALALKVILNGCASAKARYLWSFGALMLMAATPFISFAALMAGAHHGGRFGFADPILSPSWQRWPVGLWLVGVVMLSLRALSSIRAAVGLGQACERVTGVLAERCVELAGLMAPGWRVSFKLSDRLDSPVVIGWLRPVVLLPLAALTNMPSDELEALILHELAHVRRLDAFANLLQTAVETLLFYHPAVWWVSKIIRTEREHCCDDLAVVATGDPARYVRALANMEMARRGGVGMALGAAGGSLLLRARRQLRAQDLALEGLTSSRMALVLAILTGAVMASSLMSRTVRVDHFAVLAQPVRNLGRALTETVLPSLDKPSQTPATPPVRPAQVPAAVPLPAGPTVMAVAPKPANPAAPAPLNQTAVQPVASAPATSFAPPSDTATKAQRAQILYDQIKAVQQADRDYYNATLKVRSSQDALDKTLRQLTSLATAALYPRPNQVSTAFLNPNQPKASPSTQPRATASAQDSLPLAAGGTAARVDAAKLVAYLDAEPVGRLARSQQADLSRAQAALVQAIANQQSTRDRLVELTAE